MLTTAAKRALVRARLDYVRDECRRLTEREASQDASTGLVARVDAVGGHSGRVSDITATKAITSALNSLADKNANNWLCLVTDVYVELYCQQAKGMREAEHDRVLAWVLHEKIFGGKRGVEIAGQYDRLERCMTEGMISKYYAEVVELCLGVAEARGMI